MACKRLGSTPCRPPGPGPCKAPVRPEERRVALCWAWEWPVLGCPRALTTSRPTCPASNHQHQSFHPKDQHQSFHSARAPACQGVNAPGAAACHDGHTRGTCSTRPPEAPQPLGPPPRPRGQHAPPLLQSFLPPSLHSSPLWGHWAVQPLPQLAQPQAWPPPSPLAPRSILLHLFSSTPQLGSC